MLNRTKRKLWRCGCKNEQIKCVEPQVFSKLSCPPPPPPPCIPKTCGCFDKVNALDKKVDTLKGDVAKNKQDIKDNYDYLSSVISDLAYQHSKDIRETTTYINQIDSDNDAALQQEREQRITGDNNLQQQINNLTQTVNNNESDIEDKLSAEITRATGEESRIENKLDGEIYRSTQEDIRIENKIDNNIASMNAHLEDILGIDAQGVSEIKAILSDNDTTTGLIVELSKKALDSDLQAEKTRSLNKDNAHDTAISNLQSTKADKASMTAGTYTQVTVNNQGIVTAGANPTTIAGYGLTDAYTKTEIDNMINNLTAQINILKSYWSVNSTTNVLETSYIIEPLGYK